MCVKGGVSVFNRMPFQKCKYLLSVGTDYYVLGVMLYLIVLFQLLTVILIGGSDKFSIVQDERGEATMLVIGRAMIAMREM